MEHFCNIHRVPFNKFEKDGRSWYSHKTEDPAFPKGYCNEPKEASTAPKPYPQSIGGSSMTKTSDVDWDAKDRQSMAQTAMKSASEICAALIMSGSGIHASAIAENPITNVKEMANEFYKEIRKMKALVNSPEDLDNWQEGQ